MQIKFKLLAVFLACGLFLVGCGGGGGSNGDGNNTSQDTLPVLFSEVDSAFPAFPSVTANLQAVQKSKMYNVSRAAFDDFNASVLGGYNFDDSTGLYEYDREDPSTHIKYYANYNSTANTLSVSIAGINLLDFSILDDDEFDNEFDSINGSLIEVGSFFYYDGDISSSYSNYVLNSNYLGNKGFNCAKSVSTGNKYICNKPSDDNTFTYIWQEVSDQSYLYAVKRK
ncbi:MAG: hypothetical protein LBS39_03060 [Campylobacteraceae bacterium]|jgi:hypothetical protein|nr:hypothetical protein [Campylobacteraceae bacterium]